MVGFPISNVKKEFDSQFQIYHFESHNIAIYYIMYTTSYVYIFYSVGRRPNSLFYMKGHANPRS